MSIATRRKQDIPYQDWLWLTRHGLDHLKPDHEGWVMIGPGVQERIIAEIPRADGAE